MVRCLELFSGTGSVGKCCKELGIDVVSVDLEMDADFKCDVMVFDYKQFPKDHFDIVWASPPCTFYSRLQFCWKGRKKKDGILVTDETIEASRLEADILMRKTLEIIDYFSPPMWFLENPLSSLKDREVMKDRFYHIVDYCKYSDWGYQKRTCIWTNKTDWTALTCKKDCENMVFVEKQKIHKERMGTSKTVEDNGKIIRVNSAQLREKYKDYPNLQGQHKIVLANGYEMIDGKQVVCNTKEKRDKLRQHKSTATGGSTKIKGEWVKKGTSKLHDRYRIPPNLIYSLFLD